MQLAINRTRYVVKIEKAIPATMSNPCIKQCGVTRDDAFATA